MPTKGGGSPTEVANLATGAAPQEAVFSGGRAARANFDQIGTASLRGAGDEAISSVALVVKRIRFARDSPLEGTGFEPPVPRLG